MTNLGFLSLAVLISIGAIIAISMTKRVYLRIAIGFVSVFFAWLTLEIQQGGRASSATGLFTNIVVGWLSLGLLAVPLIVACFIFMRHLRADRW